MANDLTKNPLILDTAGATVLWKGRMKIDNIDFCLYNLDTDNCEIQDFNGRSVWIGNGAQDLETVRSGRIGWIDGLRLTTLTAGKVYICIAP